MGLSLVLLMQLGRGCRRAGKRREEKEERGKREEREGREEGARMEDLGPKV